MGYEAGVLKSNRGSDGVVETTVERRQGRVSLMNQTCTTPKTRPSRVTDSEGGCRIGALGRVEYQDAVRGLSIVCRARRARGGMGGRIIILRAATGAIAAFLDPLRKQRNSLVSISASSQAGAIQGMPAGIPLAGLAPPCSDSQADRGACIGDAGGRQNCRPQNSKRRCRCASVWNVDCLADRQEVDLYEPESQPQMEWRLASNGTRE